MRRSDPDPIPMPPPVSNTLMNLQAPNTFSSNDNFSTTPNVPEPSVPQISLPSSVINLSNSSDVVIGPMTQYQGSVTIYQYMDATVEGRIQSITGTNNRQQEKEKKSTTFFRKYVTSQTILLFVVFMLVVVGFIIRIYNEFYKFPTKIEEEDHSKDILFGSEYTDETIPNLGNGHLIIDRRQWGASDIKDNNPPLPHPIHYVIITHNGVKSKPCDNVYTCSIKMRTIQDSAIAERGLTDLPANFYVSSDGYIYVGRGWEIINGYTNTSLAVCFLGDYNEHVPTERQLEGARYLLDYGLTRQFISTDYRVVAHNQTALTKSPGENVYREIKKWRRWYPCGVEGKPKCEAELLVH